MLTHNVYNLLHLVHPLVKYDQHFFSFHHLYCAMLASMVCAVVVCLSVCHKLVFY